MKNTLIITIFLLISVVLEAENKKLENQVSVDFSVVLKKNVKGVSGVNLCWLLDSDISRPRPRSMKTALSELGVGALRFPYGHLGDNYMWTTPPYEDAINGLTPRVASLDGFPKWNWAVNSDGTFKKSMDFDEYIQLCKSIDAEPLIMVNVLSFKYPNGPTKETLIKSAAEWVKYSNIIRKYGVKYWQLGNEVEHTKELTKDEYVEIFGAMAKAMKAIDPDIKVGTGVLGNVDWNNQILANYPDLVSFISTHQYTFNQKFAENGFEGWKNNIQVPILNPRKMQNLLNSNLKYKDVEIMITETGSTGGKWPEGRTNDLYKALNWFEMNMEEISLQNVKYSFFWGTHSPWGDGIINTGLEFLLTNKENDITPTGKIVELINRYLPLNLVKASCTGTYLRTYAGISSDKKEFSIFVLNKNDKTEDCQISLNGIELKKYSVQRIVFTGNSPNDSKPEIDIFNEKTKNIVTLSPVSLTIFRYQKK